MIRVLHIFHEFKFSGAEIMYVDAADVFLQEGCTLMAVATSEQLGEYAPYFEKSGYKIFHLPFPKKGISKKIKYYLEFIKFLKKEKIDVLHVHTHALMWGMSFVAWLCGTRCIYTFHNVFPTHFYSYPYHCFKRFCAKKIFNCVFHTISHSVSNHERKLYFNKTTLVFNWYASKRFYPGDIKEKLKLREELQIPNEALVLISIGGCSDIKRHSDIIKSIPKILESCKSVLYLHLGSGCLENHEQELAKSLGIEENIRFYGNITDVRKYLVVSDIYLMTSKFEGIPITTIEAMGCKIPCILYDVPGLRDFNSEGQNSLIIKEDYNLLSYTILTLHQDSSKKKIISENGKLFVDTNFELSKNVLKILNLYGK